MRSEFQAVVSRHVDKLLETQSREDVRAFLVRARDGSSPGTYSYSWSNWCLNELETRSTIDRIVAANGAMWECLRMRDDAPEAEKLAAMDRWVPSSKGPRT